MKGFGEKGMKYEKIIESISSGRLDRAQLSQIKKNADEKLKQGDMDAQAVIDAIHISIPSDKYILFMGFCPNAEVENRLDIEWKEKGICSFEYTESVPQMAAFQEVCAGDLVVLKKIESFGKTMKLFGHGRVKSIAIDDNGLHYLNMDWSKQERVIEVPMMGSFATVNIRMMEQVEKEMPSEFFEWLEEDE